MSQQTENQPDLSARYNVKAADGTTVLGTELTHEAALRLVQANEGAKMRKIKQPRPALDLGTLTASIVKPEVIKTRRRTVLRQGGTGERTPAQKAVDKLVEATYAAWVKAGKPAKWDDRPGANVRVLNVQAESLVAAVHGATAFLSAQEGHARIKALFGNTDFVEADGQRFADMVFTVIEKPANEPEATAEGPEAGK